MRPTARNRIDENLFEEIVWGVNHDAFESPLGQSLLRSYSLGAQDPEIAGLIQDQIHPLKVQEALGSLLPFRRPKGGTGEICLGLDTWGEKVFLSKDALTAGLGICGNSGSAKSTLLSALAPQIAAQQVSLWLSDMYKKQLRHLRPVFRQIGIDLVILEAKQWKWNLLQAGGRNLATHASMVLDILVRVLGLPPRSRSILRQAIHELYSKFSNWNGNKDAWPCLYDLFEWIKEKEGLNAASRDAILDRLGALLLSLSPSCAAYRLGWDASDLQRHSIVFELRSASETVKQVLCESTLFSVFQEEIERGVVNAPLSLFVAFEDAQRFMDAGQRAGDGEISPMEELAGIVRGTGKGFCVISQTTYGLSKKLTSNLATKIMGRLGSSEEYSRLGSDLGMNASQIEWAKKNLKPGTFVAQFADGGWREPFVFQIPKLRIPSAVTDQEAELSIRPLESLRVVSASEYEHWELFPSVAVNSDSESPSPKTLSEADRRFLEAVVDQPGKASSFYAKQTGISGRRSAQTRARLVSLGYLREHEVATGRRGRASIVLEPMTEAIGDLDLKEGQFR